MRKFSLVLSLILLITMVASVPAVAEEKITLTVLDCSDTCYTYRQEATEKWLESHPNVEVEYTLTTWGSLGETIMAGISSGETPDLFACPAVCSGLRCHQQRLVSAPERLCRRDRL